MALAFAAALAGVAQAADATADVTTPASDAANAAAEGSSVETLVVTAEAARVTSQAPTKASLDQMQPQSIITSKFIQQLTPETGGWTTVVSIAPSIAGGISSNGGIGDYQTLTLRGFSDGEYNITWDGIAFGDTNNPTHHSADYFPASTIGAAVVDRGPGAAGDLGQANFGGAIHLFSPDVSDTPHAVQKVTYGSFNTLGFVTTLNTGAISQLGGAKLLLNFDNRSSDGELSEASGTQFNQLAKLIVPIGDNASLTLFGSHEENHFYFEDSSGPGETWSQVLALGKDFSMTNNPLSEHYIGFNYERKRTDFEYVDFKDQITPSFNFEDQGYTYWYSNKTHSANDLTGFTGPNLNGLPAVVGPPGVTPFAAVANTSPGLSPNDIGGYDKLNEYRVLGNIIRLTQDWSFGTLKVGGLVEGSRTFRHNCAIDQTLGPEVPFPQFKVPPNSSDNCKTLEESSWLQGQAFVDFYWHPLPNLTIAPGFKYVDFTRNINAAAEKVAGEPGSIGGVKLKVVPLVGTNTYKSPLYFVTANYKIEPYWSVYGQFATSFLIPELSDLYVNAPNLNTVQPQYTTNYQLGTVYTRGNLTADADIYLINATNLQIACTIPDPSIPGALDSEFCNTGSARFDGVEGQAAYAFPSGLTLYANGSLNQATQLATPANPAIGINAALPHEELPGAPEWTAAFGGIYDHDHWLGSLGVKAVGPSVEYNTPGAVDPTTGAPLLDSNGLARQFTFHLPAYWSLDASAGYDFGHFQIKLQAFNLLNQRTLIGFAPGGNSESLYSANGAIISGGTGKPPAESGPDNGIYSFQGGRRIELTLIAKY